MGHWNFGVACIKGLVKSTTTTKEITEHDIDGYDIDVSISVGSDKPSSIFGREKEWGLLQGFLDESLGSRLAVVYGRRRQGKTTLLQELAAVTNSFYWEAAEQSSAQNLESFSNAWTDFIESGGPIRFRNWEEALESVLAPSNFDPLGLTGSVMIDEVGYLIGTAPEFPSLLQRHFGPRAQSSGKVRVILCGSIYAQMTRLLAAGQPLRGRQSLEVDVRPFDYRTAASFWGLDGHPDAAFRLHALIGGTPAYLRFAGGKTPSKGNVDRWVVDHLLNPASPLFHEGQLLVAEDPTLVDKALYWSVLGAVADGFNRRTEIADALRRSPGALAQPLAVLEAGSWIEMVPDPFHGRSTTVTLNEPIVRMHRVLIAKERRRLDLGQATAVWEDSHSRVSRLIYGPHLEWIANDWMLRFASSKTVGGSIRSSGPGILRLGGVTHQLDLVGLEPDRQDVDRICVIGEVKAEKSSMGIAELERLDLIATKLGDRAAPTVRRMLVARSGFSAELKRTSRTRSDIELVDLHRLYDGD